MDPTTPSSDMIAKALRDAYGRGYRASTGPVPESYRKKRDAWIRQYLARMPVAVPAGRDGEEGGRLERVRHVKRGTEYEVLHDCAEIQASPDSPLTDYEVCVVYRSLTDGRVWVRRRPEFRDGRFETIAAAPVSTSGDGDGGELERLSAAARAFTKSVDARQAATRAYHAAWDEQADRGIQPREMDLAAVGEASQKAWGAEASANHALCEAAKAFGKLVLASGSVAAGMDRDAVADRMQEAFPDLTRLEAECAAESAFPECLRETPDPSPQSSPTLKTGMTVEEAGSRRGFDPARGFAEIAAKQATLGLGLVDITIIRHEGKAGVLFSPRAEHVEFGDAGCIEAGEHWPSANDIVLWVDGKGAGVAISRLAQLGPEGPPAMSEWEALEVIGQLPTALTAEEHASAFRSAATRCASTAPARSRRLDARADRIETALRTLQGEAAE